MQSMCSVSFKKYKQDVAGGAVPDRLPRTGRVRRSGEVSARMRVAAWYAPLAEPCV